MDSIWIWFIIGLMLLGAELLSGAFVLVFFGLGGILTALATLVGLKDNTLQVVFFALSSLSLLFLFRKKILQSKQQAPHKKIDDQFVLQESLSANSEGTVTYQGSPWTAVNTSAENLKAGTKVKIIKIEGVKLMVRPDHGG